MLEFCGTPIFTSSLLTDRIQFRFPRSKGKRIQKKYSKKDSNYKQVPSRKIYKTHNSIIVHPDMLKEIQNLLLK